MKNILLLLLTFTITLLLTTLVAGQPSLPGNPTQAPIDGGLGILAAAGGAYALKRLRERKSIESE